MVRDRTGRFPERPHFDPTEIDVGCERLVTGFLTHRYGRVEWPLQTDDLTCLVEREVGDLDLYADLSDEGGDVEGVTEFIPGEKPRVRISALLASSDRRAHRLRTTLTHELGHVRLHGFLFELRATHLDLFDHDEAGAHDNTAAPPAARNQKCRRGGIMNAAEVDWMEWQAGYACGAFLMPALALRSLVREFGRQNKLLAEIVDDSPQAMELIDCVAQRFDVSPDAARIRLLKTHHLVAAPSATPMF